MWKFLREGATVIPGATFIPESRVQTLQSKAELTQKDLVVHYPDCHNIWNIGHLFQFKILSPKSKRSLW